LAAATISATCGVAEVDMDAITRSIELITASGVEYEFRTTAVAQLHCDEDFRAMGELIRGAKRWYIQNFVDSGCLIGSGFSAAPIADMERWRDIAAEFVENVEIRGI